jgi:hypothetical protein
MPGLASVKLNVVNPSSVPSLSQAVRISSDPDVRLTLSVSDEILKQPVALSTTWAYSICGFVVFVNSEALISLRLF